MDKTNEVNTDVHIILVNLRQLTQNITELDESFFK
jgi:hypothetical protein